MINIEYIRPRGLNDTLAFLRDHGKETKVLAGGTDIMIDLRSGALQTRYLMDVSRLSELRKIEINNDELSVGAGVTISEIYRSDVLTRFAPALKKAATQFASNQVRNVATIGGNVGNCSPCGDTIPPLLIHEAEAVVVNPDGRRIVSIEEIFGGPYHCTLRPDEIITRFILKPKSADLEFSDFKKITRRNELAIARVSMAAMVQQSTDKSISFMRFALGSCTPTPRRFLEVENFLTGNVPNEELLWDAGRMLAEGMLEITGRRPTTVYKEPAIQGLFMRMMCPLINS